MSGIVYYGVVLQYNYVKLINARLNAIFQVSTATGSPAMAAAAEAKVLRSHKLQVLH